jgi:hypothetical protein
MSDVTGVPVPLPPAIFTAIESKLADAAAHSRQATAAEFAAQALLREYCEALGFSRDSRYEYRFGDRSVVVVPRNTTSTGTADGPQGT